MGRAATGAVALAVVVAQVGTIASGPSVAATGPGPLPGRADGRPAGIVQIVAHQDDDLLFMNPDLFNDIRAGRRVTSVYTTAGEAWAGEAYAIQRQTGIRLAYARMAARAAGTEGTRCDRDPGAACWTKDEYRPLPGGPVAERYTLRSDRSVQLVFLGLPEAADSAYLGGNALRRLWDSRSGTAPAETSTLDMDGPGTRWPQRYTGARLLDMLRAVLADLDPTLVRVQDPAPDPTLWDHHAEHDHPDHVSTAWFADAAVAAHAAAGHRVLVEHYRDYNTASSPANLSATETADKYAVFRSYAERDVGLPTGAAFAAGPYASWQSRQYSRFPRSTQAVAADRDGALHVFAVKSGLLHEWAEDTDGVWRGPVVHEGAPGPLAAGVTVTRRQDGRLEVFGQRTDTGEIVSAAQGASGGWGWQAHGSPDPMAGPQDSRPADRALQVSMPVAAVSGTGRLLLFVRNRDGGISFRQQDTSGQSAGGWTVLGGTGVQDAPTAVTTRDGRVHVFAVTVGAAREPRVLHWSQAEPDGALVPDRGFPSLAPAGGIGAGTTPDGRPALFYRQVPGAGPHSPSGDDSSTVGIVQTASGGWAVAGPPGGAAAPGGTGGPVVVPADATAGRPMTVAVRNRDGGLSVSRQRADGQFDGWTDLGGSVVGVPSAGVDRDGLTVLLVLGPDGRLHHNRQRGDGSFGSWRTAVAP